MAALATPTQLGQFMQETIAANDPTALLLLDIASGMVTDFLEMQNYSASQKLADVVVLDPIDSSYVFLSGLPVTAVSQVETFDGTLWSIAPTTAYTVSLSTGVVTGLWGYGVTWPTNPGTWRVTYDHGLTSLPNSVLGVVLGVAARAYSSPVGIDLERVGGYQVKYGIEADGFSPVELRALSRYTIPRVA